MGLFAPAWKSKKWETRKNAIKKIKDQKMIANLAMNDPDWHVRQECVNYLTERACLLSVAKSTTKKMDAETYSVLSALAMDEQANRLMGGASNSNASSMLANQRKNEREFQEVVFMATKKLQEDKNALFDIALHADNDNLRGWIIKCHLLDKDMLEEIIKTEKNKIIIGFAEEAMKKFKA